MRLTGGTINFECVSDKSKEGHYSVRFSYDSPKLTEFKRDYKPRIRIQAIDQWIDVDNLPLVVGMFQEVYEYSKKLEANLVVEL